MSNDRNNVITLELEIKPKLSWRDAMKLCLAGGKAAKEFWHSIANQLRANATDTGDELKGAVERLEALGKQDLCVSVCYGPIADQGCGYTVTVLGPDFTGFKRPFQGRSFAHCVEIAEIESAEKGWLNRGNV
jgi:hypothetical protein